MSSGAGRKLFWLFTLGLNYGKKDIKKRDYSLNNPFFMSSICYYFFAGAVGAAVAEIPNFVFTAAVRSSPPWK
ncbi:hypothetical protein SPPR111872_17230 [Sphingobacterium prati]